MAPCAALCHPPPPPHQSEKRILQRCSNIPLRIFKSFSNRGTCCGFVGKVNCAVSAFWISVSAVHFLQAEIAAFVLADFLQLSVYLCNNGWRFSSNSSPDWFLFLFLMLSAVVDLPVSLSRPLSHGLHHLSVVPPADAFRQRFLYGRVCHSAGLTGVHRSRGAGRGLLIVSVWHREGKH